MHNESVTAAGKFKNIKNLNIKILYNKSTKQPSKMKNLNSTKFLEYEDRQHDNRKNLLRVSHNKDANLDNTKYQEAGFLTHQQGLH